MKCNRHYLPLLLFFSALIIAGCADKKEAQNTDPLPSWNEGKVKSSIIAFVNAAIDEANDGFIPVNERIATFDNDGNLWSEQPYYFQLKYTIDKVKQLAEEDADLQNEPIIQAVLADDMKQLLSFGEHGLIELLKLSHGGMRADAFEASVEEWLATAEHPRFERKFTELVYQPMLELLEYLQKNEFKTFVVSGGGIDFMRVWCEEAYNIPPDQVIGSSLKAEFVIENGEAFIRKLPEINFIDDKEGKPIGIHQYIGKRPVFASGNSDGDLPMLQYTASGDGPRFMLYLHHTDSIREWAYDRDSHIGRLDKGLDEARERGWSVIDMAKDWKVIYPFEK